MKYLLLLLLLPIMGSAQPGAKIWEPGERKALIQRSQNIDDVAMKTIIMDFNIKMLKFERFVARDTVVGVFVLLPHPKKLSQMIGILGMIIHTDSVAYYLDMNGDPIFTGRLKKAKLVKFFDDTEWHW